MNNKSSFASFLRFFKYALKWRIKIIIASCYSIINKIFDIAPEILLGIAVDVAAYTLGANWIERHFTLDRTWKGTDHSASLEPTGLRKLARDVRATHKALTYKTKDILDIEQVQRDKLKYRNK